MPACLLACLLACHACLLVCLLQEPGKNSLRALVSEALELPPDLGGKAVGAGDPGISTFMTVAVVDGPVLKLGEGLATHVLQSYGRHIDALEARIKDPRLVCAQRMSMARRITRLRRGAKNTVKQAAHEYALLIAARFKVFFLPHFRVSEMVVGSPLGKKVTRKMLSICHGEFRNLLVQKAALYGCQVISVSLLCVCLPCLFACLAMFTCLLCCRLCLHTADQLLLLLLITCCCCRRRPAPAAGM